MIRRISVAIGQTHPGAFYLVSAVVLSLAVNTFTSAYGTIPKPVNQVGLAVCTLAAFVSAVALAALAWRLERIQQLVNERARDAGLSPRVLLADTVQAFAADIWLKMTFGIGAAVGSVTALLVLR